MHSISDITLLSDVVGLPMKNLKEICTDLNLDDSGNKTDLMRRISEVFNKHHELLSKSENILLAGRTSVTWYRLTDELSISDVQSYVRDHSDFDPFEVCKTPELEDITSTPTLISGSRGLRGDVIFLRFVYKSGIQQEVFGNNIKTSPKVSVFTVLFDSRHGVLEIRGDQRRAEDVAEIFAQMINQQVNLEQITAPFEEHIDKIAGNLNGELLDVTAKPELLLDEFTEDQSKAVMHVLNGLDGYFKSADIDVLGDCLQAANKSFNSHLSIPFSALILAGMEKVGMGADSEIRKYPLFNYLSPNLEHQGGFIRFKYAELGIEKEYTIRVGMTTSSIFFTTPATENVIDFVMKNVIL